MDLLYSLPKESVQLVSPDSMTLKKWLKVPLLIFAILPAMVSSISELISKVMGIILMEATSGLDYLWLLLFVPIVAFTAYKTLIYI